jgi:hypothetical protein
MQAQGNKNSPFYISHPFSVANFYNFHLSWYMTVHDTVDSLVPPQIQQCHIEISGSNLTLLCIIW